MDIHTKKLLKTGSDCSGVGAFDQALIRLGVDYEKIFACDFDYNARLTYVLNFGTENDLEIAKSKKHKMFCSGMEFIILGKSEVKDIKSFEITCKKLDIKGIDLNSKKMHFSKEANEFSKTFSFYYPFNMYDREIPNESLDIYCSTVPCQAFSLAGKRLGKADIKGILFFNSLEFIDKNRPKYFSFENVKGLLSDDKTNKKALYGNTFQEWINYLGGKSVNGNPTFFPYEDSVPYHIYFKVLNAKDYGVPQNRERIFIIGIRDDEDNNFNFPMPFPLEKRLKDVLEPVVDEKYFLSDEAIKRLCHNESGFYSEYKTENDIASTLCASDYKLSRGMNVLKLDEIIQLNDPVHSNDRIYSDEGISPTLNTMQGGNRQPFVQVSENPIMLEHRGHLEKEPKLIYDGIVPCLRAESHGHETKIIVDEEVKVVCFGRSEEGDSIVYDMPNSKTRRGRVGKQVSQTIDTSCNQGVLIKQRIRRLTPTECFRLMDFNPEMIEKTISSGLIFDSQLYKQAGNSICIEPLKLLIQKMLKL